MKLTRALIFLVVLALIGTSVFAQTQSQANSEAESWCGTPETKEGKECGAADGFTCIKCPCKGGRISRGFRPSNEVFKEIEEAKEFKPSVLCVSIWAWLGPLLAVIVIGGGVGVWCFMRKKSATASS